MGCKKVTMYKQHSVCRACRFGAPVALGKAAPPDQMPIVFDLGIQPLANDFAHPDQQRKGHYPLKVCRCPRCGLAQLTAVVDPKILYGHYSYVTSASETMQKHFSILESDLSVMVKGRTILEIGSNDGLLLEFMKNKGWEVAGVDPATNLVDISRKRGIMTFNGLFNEQLADSLPTADIILARHVFCHIDDWKGFILGAKKLLKSGGKICIEAPYMGDMLANNEFDTVYHEHLSYLNFGCMRHLLAGTGLGLEQAIKYDIHGGAVLMVISFGDGNLLTDTNCTLSDWHRFELDSKSNIAELRHLVSGAVSGGKRVMGLGASAKSTVWINACGFDRKHIEFIGDSTPQKQYTLSPGTNIPIIDEHIITRELPDYVIVWCWNFKDEVIRKFDMARSKGVQFIIPVPRIHIV